MKITIQKNKKCVFFRDVSVGCIFKGDSGRQYLKVSSREAYGFESQILKAWNAKSNAFDVCEIQEIIVCE